MADKVINKMAFGKKIKAARENLKLTQFELSEEVGISQNFLGDIERGLKLPSIETLVKLANILKVNLDYILSDSLDNILAEPEGIYYTNRQLAIINSMINSIKENFEK